MNLLKPNSNFLSGEPTSTFDLMFQEWLASQSQPLQDHYSTLFENPFFQHSLYEALDSTLLFFQTIFTLPLDAQTPEFSYHFHHDLSFLQFEIFKQSIAPESTLFSDLSTPSHQAAFLRHVNFALSSFSSSNNQV